MLEIIAIYWLCQKNAELAAARNRNTFIARAYTLLLWLGMEIFGTFIGYNIISNNYQSFPTYALALVLAGLGGLISWLISKRGAPLASLISLTAEETAYLQQSSLIASPCQVSIDRESKGADAMIRHHVELNGQSVGTIKNGGTLAFFTDNRLNVVTTKQTDSNKRQAPVVYFEAQPGGTVQLFMNRSGLIPEQTVVYTQEQAIKNQPQAMFQ
ncbi:MAG: cytochrome c-type biogenesis protein CcmH [Coriobacteriia bacterium]|nr:cytochrome c-type biogenesis protein CcmH [Coriobacteriia bacterium]